jgi:2-amino-4-hydroxy-6-hydroxymethyldihydropteridine diphosphokinase
MSGGATRITAYVGLGANLGDAPATLARACIELAALPLTDFLAASSVYRSAPVDAAGPDFVNQVAALHTLLSAHALLRSLLAIERAHGRERPYRNAPRTLDLDLLLFGDAVIAAPDLVVPHPRMHERAFVLAPLAELSPGLVIPGRGPVAALLPSVAAQRIERLASAGS